MLRGLVLLFALVNVMLFFWLGSEPGWSQADREPQRLQRQVAPEAIQVLPDLPEHAASAALAASDAEAAASGAARAYGGPTGGASAAAGSSTPAALGGAAASAATRAVTPASAPARIGGVANGADSAVAATAGVFARKASDTEVACAESGPLSQAQVAALRQSLVRAGVPPEAVTERRLQRPAAWMIYMGRYADPQVLQRKADELRRMNVSFAHVSAPASLEPGLSLGSFASAEEAAAHLDELGSRGVHTARVVAVAPSVAHRLQVRAGGASWRAAIGTQRFDDCTTEATSSL